MGRQSILQTETRKVTLTTEAWRFVEELQKHFGMNRAAQVIEQAVRTMHKAAVEEKK